MARKAVNPAMLQGLVEGSQNQEVQKGTPRTTDPNYPVFATPINEDVIVYIPSVNVRATENGNVMDVLNALIHDGKKGRSFVSLRCVSGLNSEHFHELGYDGICPACEATRDAWDLYNLKMAAEAKRLNIDPQNDPSDTLKPVREKILQEMDLKGAEEYVTFPIVIIPTKGQKVPADDVLQSMRVEYVFWRKKRYEEAILGALSSLMVNPGHPAGLFWFWKFSYDAKGKQHTARDSAKNAKYSIITEAQALQMYEPLKEAAEAKASTFTLLKAAEVIVANQFMYKEDIEAEVTSIMQKTRTQLDMAKLGSTPALGSGQTASLTPGTNPLTNFGVDQGQAGGNLGVETQQPAPQAPPIQQAPPAQQAAPAPAPQVQFGVDAQPAVNPVTFGG
jgi:hypothetical protein